MEESKMSMREVGLAWERRSEDGRRRIRGRVVVEEGWRGRTKN